MERLTSYKNDCKREMICRYEDCDTCEEYCPHLNEDNCPCLQEVLEKLAEYEDLEEQGKLLKLHCSVGDMVYVISDDCDYGFGECHTKMLCENCEYRNLHIEGEIFSLSQIALRMNDFGKTVFLTRQEAEDKLAETEGKK